MSCFGCSKSYGIFTKEYGCPNCGYSYCAKCLKRPVAVPKHNDKVMNVCLICYDKLSKLQAPEKVVDVESLPGTIVTKTNWGQCNEKIINTDINTLLEVEPSAALTAEVLAPISPITMTASTHSSGENSDITENLDSEIVKRLKNLKTSDQSQLPSDDELRSRLANLNGVPYKDYSKKDLLLNMDQRTDQEKMNDLLEQFMGESQIDRQVEAGRNDAISDIERRLRALRDVPVEAGGGAVGTAHRAVGDVSPDTNTPSDNEMDDEAILKDIMQKYLAEARLPEVPPPSLETEVTSGIPPPPQGVETEELPWCNICNEDAVYRCIGCEGELFCAPCYRECHDDDEEYRAHVKEPYSAPPKFVENHF